VYNFWWTLREFNGIKAASEQVDEIGTRFPYPDDLQAELLNPETKACFRFGDCGPFAET
jgi:hypothetical protein